MQEEQRLQRNSARLGECFGVFAEALSRVITDMERLGFRPRIQEAWRSPQAQLEAFNNGTSELKFGFHNVTAADGRKESLAVDLLDDDAPVNPSRRYLLTLAAVARDHGLETGLLWGLQRSTRELLETAIRERNFDAPGKIGWDPCHVQITGMTPAEAKRGLRPTPETLSESATAEEERVVAISSVTRSLLVKAVSGPARVHVGDVALYRATAFNLPDPTPQEKTGINWDIVSGDQAVAQFMAVGETLHVDVTPDFAGKTIRVRPFRHAASNQVSVVTTVEAVQETTSGSLPGVPLAPKMVAIEREGMRYFAKVDGSPRFFVGSDVRFQDKRGLMNTRDESGRPYNPADHRGAFGFWADFIYPTALCESKGFFQRINTYDVARFTFGFFQHAAHTPNDNFVLLLRQLLALPQAAAYFPDLTLVDGAVHRITDQGMVRLETPDSTEHLMKYLNPSGDVVDDVEAINAAKVIDWCLNDTAHRTLQVAFTISQQKKRMAEYDRRYRLDGVADTICLVVADIRHQGRARSQQIIEALESNDALNNLLRIGEDGFPERIRTLRDAIGAGVGDGVLGVRKYRAATNDFEAI